MRQIEVGIFLPIGNNGYLLSVMTALAASTQRLRLIATMSPPLLHPVVAAKMAATSGDSPNA